MYDLCTDTNGGLKNCISASSRHTVNLIGDLLLFTISYLEMQVPRADKQRQYYAKNLLIFI